MPIGTDSYYQEMLDNAKNYNKRICIERRQRLPFLDSQTGVAQNHSGLSIPYRYRGPGRKFGQIYTYPSRRWKKKSSLMFNEYPVGKVKVPESETSEENLNISSLLNSTTSTSIFHPTSEATTNNSKLPNFSASNSNSNEADLPPQQPSNPVATMAAAVVDESAALSTDWDVQSDGADLENPKHQSDSSDYEETYVKKRKKAKGGEKGKSATKDPSFRGPKRGSGKARVKKEKEQDSSQDKDKPYSCEYCPMKYKTRPGLSYHMSHSHNKSISEEDPSSSPPKKAAADVYSKKPPMPHPPHHHQQSPQQPPPPQPPQQLPPPPPPPLPPPVAAIQQQQQQQPPPPSNFSGIYNPAPPETKPGNRYCDFCLGDENENKKTGFKEEMVSCADCGRSGHPSCLQFSANMIISVKRYPWQCIECKSCGICGTSDNDDQLLFCDDCDRGYHMYCLKPPLSEPPEGSWSCHLCLREFYSGSKDMPLCN